MRRTREEFEAYSIMELFYEIISLEKGDLWDGMSSKANRDDCNLATEVFIEKMKALGIV